MQDYLDQLRNRANNGDKEAQVILFFKLYYDLRDPQMKANLESIKLCCKFRTTNLLLDGMCHHLGLSDDKQDSRNWQASFEIFNAVAENAEDSQMIYYAWSMIGLSYIYGMGVSCNIKQGIEYLEKAANKGNEWAQYDLGRMLLSRQQHLDVPRAIQYIERSAYQYNRRAIRELGCLYVNKRYNPVDSKNLLELYLSIDPLYKKDLKFIKFLVSHSDIEWDRKYHKYWPALSERVGQRKDSHGRKNKNYYISYFNEQIMLLLLISKHRQHSQFLYVNYFSRIVANTTIKQLAGLWKSGSDRKF